MTFMLSTKDNPYHPQTQWDDWYRYDTTHGYNTCATLDRLSSDIPENLGDSLKDEYILQTMSRMVDSPFNIHQWILVPIIESVSTTTDN